MFPSEEQQNEYLDSISKENNISFDNKEHKASFIFDFKNGEFNLKSGAKDGVEALKMWIQKILKTSMHKYLIYELTGDKYGTMVKEKFHSDAPKSFAYASMEMEIKEVLMAHEAIKNVYEFSFDKSNRTLLITFTVDTIYGNIKEEVNI